METIGTHVTTYGDVISQHIFGKDNSLQFPSNGLTTTNLLEMNTQNDQSAYVIVHSEQAQSAAEKLQDEIQEKGPSVSLLCLTDPKDLKEKIQLDLVSGLYMVVNENLFKILFQGRHLHPDVDEFMDELEKKETCISLFNRMEKGDQRFMKIFHHLPDKCTKIVREITVQTGKVKDVKKKLSTSIKSCKGDSSSPGSLRQEPDGNPSDSQINLNDVRGTENGDKDTVRNLNDDQRSAHIKCDPVKSGPGGDGGDIKDEVSKGVTGLMSSPKGMVASHGTEELMREESHRDETEVKSDKEEEEPTEDESLSEGSEDEAQPSSDVHAVQIGCNQTMEVQWMCGQMVNISQEGLNNSIEVNVVPPLSKSKVIVVFTTNPSDKNLENLMVKEITKETEIINVRIEALGASHLKVNSGSVVIEIEVKPGVMIDKAYIQKLMEIIFSGNVGKVIPEGTKLGVDIETKMMVPFEQLGKYVHLNPDNLHENCVSKEKYCEKVEEVRQLKRRLGKEGSKEDHPAEREEEREEEQVLSQLWLSTRFNQELREKELKAELMMPRCKKRKKRKVEGGGRGGEQSSHKPKSVKIGDKIPGSMTTRVVEESCAGYEDFNSIEIHYHIPEGSISKPGSSTQGYNPVYDTANLPNSGEGQKVLSLLKVAWERGLTYKLERGGWRRQIWHKEYRFLPYRELDPPPRYQWELFGPRRDIWDVFGPRSVRRESYPDRGYLQKVQEELRNLGVTEEDI